jgi:hypothetical protein
LLLTGLTLPARASYDVKRITDNYQTYAPKANNRGMVVWAQSGSDFKTHIFLYNNGNISQIDNNINGAFLPGMNDLGQITWWGLDDASQSYQVYISNNGNINQLSSTNNGNRLVAPSANSEFPHINNLGQVAWIGSDGLSNQVFLFSNKTVYKISHNDEDGQPRGGL